MIRKKLAPDLIWGGNRFSEPVYYSPSSPFLDLLGPIFQGSFGVSPNFQQLLDATSPYLSGANSGANFSHVTLCKLHRPLAAEHTAAAP